MLFTMWISDEDNETYWTCEDCSPHSEEDINLCSDEDRHGDHSCEICGKELNHDTMEYETYDQEEKK